MADSTDGSMMVHQKTGMQKTMRFMNRLGFSSLLLGICAALIKTWVTYWLGPTRGPVAPPEQTAMVEVQAAKPRTVEDLLQESPITLADWQVQIEQHLESHRQSGITSQPAETAAQNERRFRPYLGKEVVWEGYFDQFHVVKNPASPDQGCTLILRESLSDLTKMALLGPPFIRCWLPRSTESQLSQLQRGQWIVIRGRLSDPSLAGSLLCTDLSGCELVTASEIRNVETAVSPQETVIR